MKFTPGRRGIVISSRTSIVAFVECDACSGELNNQVVLTVIPEGALPTVQL